MDGVGITFHIFVPLFSLQGQRQICSTGLCCREARSDSSAATTHHTGGILGGNLEHGHPRPSMFHATQHTVNRTMFRSFHSRARDKSVQQVCAVVKREVTALLPPKHSRKNQAQPIFRNRLWPQRPSEKSFHKGAESLAITA